MTDLPKFESACYPEFASEAYGINDQGMVVGACQFTTNDGNGGESGLYDTNTNFFVFHDARSTVLAGVGDSGLAVGWFAGGTSLFNPYPARGFYVTADGKQGFLDVPNARQTWLRGINSAKQIAGYYDDGQHIHGFLWNPTAQSPTTLDFPGAIHTEVHGITDPNPLTVQIQIVGSYVLETDPPFTRHGFLAAPAPVVCCGP